MQHTDEINLSVRHNFKVNVLDGAFFGLAMGLASFVTVIPLFVNSLTDSTLLIGLIATIHTLGWQLPQLMTAGYVARLRRFRPMVMMMTLHERWPFFGLALVALLIPVASAELVLVLLFSLLVVQGLGGGMTANAWQSMLGKIIPDKIRGTFFGVQSAAASFLSSLGALLAGFVLGAVAYPGNFALCFFLAGIAMAISMGFLSRTREPESAARQPTPAQLAGFRANLLHILRADANFRWFLLSRVFSQFGMMALAFYTVYATRTYGMDAQTAGLMTGVLLLAQTLAGPIIGWAGDRWGHRVMLGMGNLLLALAALLALGAPDLSWFYAVFFLAGFANSIQWTTIIAITVQFGPVEERPFYIGLTNTLIAPATLAAPVIGGFLADTAGFDMTFLVCVGAALAAAALTFFIMSDPYVKQKPEVLAAAMSDTP